MKKKILIIIPILLVIGLLIFGVFIKNKNKENDNSNNKIVELSMADLNKKIEDKDTFILLITQTGCSHCEAFLKTVKNTIKDYDIVFYDINLTNLSSDEQGQLKLIANTSGTPTTVFIKDGVEETTLNRIVGETSEAKLVEKLTKQGYIKE